jgi:hypothetical protein
MFVCHIENFLGLFFNPLCPQCRAKLAMHDQTSEVVLSWLLRLGWLRVGCGLATRRFLGTAGGRGIRGGTVWLGRHAPPSRTDPASPAPARVAFWVTRGRQVTANGGGRLTRAVKQRSRAAGGASGSLAAAALRTVAHRRRRAWRVMDRPVAAAAAASAASCEGAGGPGPGPGASWRPSRVAGGASASSRHPSIETLDR